MFNVLQRVKPQGSEVTLQIEGMHCTSCAFNIEGALEDLDGVKSASASYAKSEVTVTYDHQVVNTETMIKAIADAGYRATKSG